MIWDAIPPTHPGHPLPIPDLIHNHHNLLRLLYFSSNRTSWFFLWLQPLSYFQDWHRMSIQRKSDTPYKKLGYLGRSCMRPDCTQGHFYNLFLVGDTNLYGRDWKVSHAHSKIGGLASWLYCGGEDDGVQPPSRPCLLSCYNRRHSQSNSNCQSPL